MDTIIGREDDLARIIQALPPDASGPLVVLGDPGIGKTVLIDAAVAHARRQGVRVLSARGSAAETELPFAGLHQLLRPVLDQAGGLPPGQRTALVNAFGTATDPTPPDRMLIGLAVLTLLSTVADAGPLLLVVDDLPLLDPGSSEVVAFLARRLQGEPIGLLATGRSTPISLPALVLGPLSPADAERLLDAQPDPPSGAARRRILAAAEGNPLALVELAKVAPGPAGLPLTERLERAFAAHVTDLPEATRHALLVAAAADTTDLALVQAALPADFTVWSPAEQAGLVQLDHGRIQFRHPLVRSAIYGAEPFDVRRQAHLALAAALGTDPDRRAWQLSAGTVSPDEEVAAALEGTADRAFVRGATAEAMHALERAGQLSPDPREHGRRLAKAAVIAIIAGDMPRAEELTSRARTLTDEPATQIWLDQTAGTAATYRMRLDDAFTLLLPAAEQSGGHGRIAQNAAVLAAVNAYYTGQAAQRDRIAELIMRFDQAPISLRLWLLGAVEPHRNGDAIRAQLPAAVAAAHTDSGELTVLGMVAAVLDDTATAITVLDRVANPAREDASTAQGGMAAANLGWAQFDAGQFDDARRSIAHLPAGTLAGTLAFALDTTLLALSGSDRARPQAADLLAIAEPAGIGAITARARWAAGMAAGDQETAYRHFRDLFDSAGAPTHYHLSYYGIADLAAAARPDHVEEARMIVKRATGTTSPRLALILQRAKALLADPAEAEQHFVAALDPIGSRWPFERARTRLDFGEWLRRRRRIADARTNLTAAREVFERLGAEPWAERARAELRAAGVAVTPAAPNRLDTLSPQRRQIVQLAAEGLTNREIGERLFLSPRTVGFHLYKAFPALGVTTRAQLRDVIDGPDDH